jgi:thioredoxin-related protein
MKNLLIVSTILVIASSFGNINSLPIGSSIPKASVRVKDVSGREVMLNDVKKENGLLVMFSCNTCPVVIKNQSRTKEVCQFAGDKKIGVILLNANEGDRNGGNSFEEMQSYARAQGYRWFYAVDKNSELADAFGANKTPESFLFDKNGKLVYHGAIDDNPGDMNAVKRHYLREAIDEVVSGKDVSVKETRSIGCTISRAN